MTEAVSGHELAKSFDCRTPGCTGEARSRGGRHAYCRECQIRRGTRHPDGTLIVGLIPASPGSRRVRDLWKGDGCGPFEAKGIELIAAAREVDALLGDIAQAQDRIAGAKAKLPAAVHGWQTTLEQLVTTDPRSLIVASSPNSSNGSEPAAADK